ncbi:MAG: polysaccharide biosynthesis tyrosine autokinase [candidate division Zixibacteria bacterium]|nr:polysaccharide biosynthesis tyrosine autokinase [candidate division Zixibacteria bacterium]
MPSRPLTDREKLTSCVAIGSFVAKQDTVMAEQFRKLRGLITTQTRAKGLRTLLVTSCMPEEGKTTVTLNLASTIARGPDDSVILVDADLRRLNLTKELGLQNAPGLLDILQQRVSIEQAMVDTEIGGLTLIPGGVNPGNPAELVESERMRDFLRQLTEQYRDSYVIIDSTPIVSTSEVHVLSGMVDGVIVVIMAEKTRRDVVKRELKTLNAGSILGVVLNCAEFETSDYYRKYQKYYSVKEKS